MNILVLCTGNSARSILLESILNTKGAPRVRAYSAGSAPTGKVHPRSLRLLREFGHDVSNARSKSWDEFTDTDAPALDIVITVCDNAAAETCPIWPGAPVQAHWGTADPAAAKDADKDAAFRRTYGILERWADALLALPLAALDTKTLQAKMSEIGHCNDQPPAG